MKRLTILFFPLILLAQDNYVFGPSIRVNDDSAGMYSHRTTQRAIACSGDTVYLVWGDNRLVSAQIYFSKSIDEGNTWSPNTIISQNIDTLVCVLPHIILDASGNIYVAYMALHDNMTNADIYITKSTDCGMSFTPAVMVNDSASVYHQRYPAVAVDSSGQYVYVVWEDCRNIQYEPDIYFSRSTDGGITFFPSTRVNDDLDTTDHWFPVIACNESSQYVYVAWMDERDTLHGWDVYFSRSTDYGQTFEANYPVNDTVTTGNTPQEYPSICYKNGIIHVAWRDGRDPPGGYYAKSINNGIGFGPNILVTNDPWAGIYSSIAADSSANTYIVWRDYRNYVTFGHEIYFSFSSDSGETFSDDVLVNDHQGIISAWDWNPAVCVNDSGKVFVAWSSTRNDPSFSNFDIYSAGGTYVGIVEEARSKMTEARITAYPNPFRNHLVIQYAVCTKHYAPSISIYDVTGRLVKSFDSVVDESPCSVIWNGTDDYGQTVPGGVYFVRLVSNNKKYIKKVVKIGGVR